MGKPAGLLLSIAIPTRNRQKYLKILLTELLTNKREDFEVIIQDNSDSDTLSGWINTLNDARIRYKYHAGWISVVDNCDAALRECRGEYICMLGDDDGILLDESLAALADARVDRIDAVMGTVLNYVWPDLDHHLLRDYGGKLYLKSVKGNISSNDFLATAKQVVRLGGAMGLMDLPCVYHGFISRRALSELYQAIGTYFPGPSPDMANAIALCAVLKSLRRTTEILVITGHSVVSTAGAGTQRRHHGSIADQPHLPKGTVNEWHSDIPSFWSGPTIYAQTLRSALIRTQSPLLGEVKNACLYAACLIYHTEYWIEVIRSIRHSKKGNFLLYAEIVFYCAIISARRARNLLARTLMHTLKFGKEQFLPANTIAEAIGLTRCLKERPGTDNAHKSFE